MSGDVQPERANVNGLSRPPNPSCSTATGTKGWWGMRFFDNWWEHLPTVVRLARLASLSVAIIAAVHGTPVAGHNSLLDHYWE
jgi:hypothetical protein